MRERRLPLFSTPSCYIAVAGQDANSSQLWRFCDASNIFWQVNILLLALTLSAQPQSTFAAESLRRDRAKLAPQRASEGGQPRFPEMWGAWCARCHAGDGSGKINEPTVTVVPMDFTDCKLATPEPDADWEQAIAKGGPGSACRRRCPRSRIR